MSEERLEPFIPSAEGRGAEIHSTWMGEREKPSRSQKVFGCVEKLKNSILVTVHFTLPFREGG